MKKYLILFAILLLTGCQQPNLGASKISEEAMVDKYNQSSEEIKNKYKLEDATLVKTDIKNAELDKYKGEPKDEIKITLGNKDAAEFTPDIELKRWNEVSFKIKPKGLDNVAIKDKDLKLEDGKVKFKTPKMDFEMFDYEDGYKYIWYLNEKPASNKMEFEIQSEGLDFFRQPPLTEEYQNGYNEEFQKEIIVSETQVKDLEGNILVERPENVVGSYAVYHQTKGGMVDSYGKDYKTGKAFHIFRPHLIDANGVETWGILKIENGIYSVEIPQEFLDNAVYPIKSNDFFGYTGIGGTGTFKDPLIASGPFASSGTGTATSIQFHTANAGSLVKDINMAIYDKDKILVFNGVSNIISGNIKVYTWHIANFSTNPSITAQNYWLAVQISDDSDPYINCDNTVGYTIYYGMTNSYPSFLTPLSGGSTLADYRLSIYVTYTPGGGATSCTYSGTGDWNVNYTDNCYISSDVYVNGACYFINNGAGSFGMSADISCLNKKEVGYGFNINKLYGADITLRY